MIIIFNGFGLLFLPFEAKHKLGGRLHDNPKCKCWQTKQGNSANLIVMRLLHTNTMTRTTGKQLMGDPEVTHFSRAWCWNWKNTSCSFHATIDWLSCCHARTSSSPCCRATTVVVMWWLQLSCGTVSTVQWRSMSATVMAHHEWKQMPMHWLCRHVSCIPDISASNRCCGAQTWRIQDQCQSRSKNFIDLHVLWQQEHIGHPVVMSNTPQLSWHRHRVCHHHLLLLQLGLSACTSWPPNIQSMPLSWKC